MGVDCDILCVAIGCNDLMRSDESSIVSEYPAHLDADLTKLATAMKEKAQHPLVLIGGPSSIWGYPEHWDDFMEHMYDLMVNEGVPAVPTEVAGEVMADMPLQDGVHFTNSDAAKTLFAKSWASWIELYAGVPTQAS